jgi:long-chain fatty acid transport protein
VIRGLVTLAALAALVSRAAAGGMVLSVKGVRDVERAGALVAGAEDADSLWLNPAGLAHLVGTRTIFVGMTYVNQDVDYTRIDSGNHEMGTISNQYPGIGVPTIAFAMGLDDKLVVGGGITAPYTGLHRYDVAGTQRYASISLAESLSVQLTAGAAYRLTPKLRVGATIQNVISKLDSRVVLSGCPGQTVCAPEDPEFDADTRVVQTDLFSPTASFGVQYDVHRTVTVGASFLLPGRVSSTGKLTTKLPSSGFYEGASVSGDKAKLEFDVPAVARAGIEVHPNDRLRIETALEVELWSTHDAITITPENVRIENVAGVGTYEVGPTVIPRNYKNSYAVSLGGEYAITRALSIGAGYAYETAAAPKGYVSVLTVDANKHLVGLGGSYQLGTWALGASAGFVKLADVDLTMDDAKVPQLTPVRGQPSDVYVNAGHYHSSYVLAGVRVAKQF